MQKRNWITRYFVNKLNINQHFTPVHYNQLNKSLNYITVFAQFVIKL